MSQFVFLARNTKTNQVRFAWIEHYLSNELEISGSIPKYSTIRGMSIGELRDNYPDWVVAKLFIQSKTKDLFEVIERLDQLSKSNNSLFQLLCDFGEECANLSPKVSRLS